MDWVALYAAQKAEWWAPSRLPEPLPEPLTGVWVDVPEDPDGPLEPMMPAFWHNAAACLAKDAALQASRDRDDALVRALRFT